LNGADLPLTSNIQKHTVDLGTNTKTTGLLNITADQSDVYSTFKTGKLTSKNVQLSLL
jgi:hypothetical protein